MKRYLQALPLVLAIVMLLTACTTAATISPEDAQTIALQDAGFTAADVKGLAVQADRDDGRRHYDVSFFKDGTEYDYEIDATTGAIVSFDADVETIG